VGPPQNQPLTSKKEVGGFLFDTQFDTQNRRFIKQKQ